MAANQLLKFHLDCFTEFAIAQPVSTVHEEVLARGWGQPGAVDNDEQRIAQSSHFHLFSTEE